MPERSGLPVRQPQSNRMRVLLHDGIGTRSILRPVANARSTRPVATDRRPQGLCEDKRTLG
jgi:hypothetical protein